MDSINKYNKPIKSALDKVAIEKPKTQAIATSAAEWAATTGIEGLKDFFEMVSKHINDYFKNYTEETRQKYIDKIESAIKSAIDEENKFERSRLGASYPTDDLRRENEKEYNEQKTRFDNYRFSLTPLSIDKAIIEGLLKGMKEINEMTDDQKLDILTEIIGQMPPEHLNKIQSTVSVCAMYSNAFGISDWLKSMMDSYPNVIETYKKYNELKSRRATLKTYSNNLTSNSTIKEIIKEIATISTLINNPKPLDDRTRGAILSSITKDLETLKSNLKKQLLVENKKLNKLTETSHEIPPIRDITDLETQQSDINTALQAIRDLISPASL